MLFWNCINVFNSITLAYFCSIRQSVIFTTDFGNQSNFHLPGFLSLCSVYQTMLTDFLDGGIDDALFIDVNVNNFDIQTYPTLTLGVSI